ncbi:phage SPO1 DNA polymerase-related protein [Methylocaldum marinum]|uniref:Type-4 uracil-DNA glycosylase n=1 Tax=Methylocaldum marinum TaxID=1432792 RepID=A0A250L1C4_9GAMM|nr:uracil-DNA glycosylase [Methylocaldum marinum]BBA37181.1 phage SPO1 DNA polymerase-related protein [Methylocaldum marinum]
MRFRAPVDAEESCEQLENLARGIRRCVACRLHQSRRQAVPGEGPANAEIVVLGEGPGSKEDATGRPFVGPAGRYLDQLFRSQGIARDRLFITNCVKCRPPENRTPRRDELKICTNLWLKQQIELISPKFIVLLGQIAARQMLGETATVSQLHGTVQTRNGQNYFVTYHPAAALRFDWVAVTLKEDFEILGSRHLRHSASVR